MDELAVEIIAEELKKLTNEKKSTYASYSVSKVSDEFLMKIAKILRNWGFKPKEYTKDWIIAKRKKESIVLFYDNGLLNVMYLVKS